MANADGQARRMIARAPEEFNLKKSFDQWAKQFRNYHEVLELPAAQVYRTFLSFLDGECFCLVEALELTNAEKANIYEPNVFRRIRGAFKSNDQRVDPDYLLKYRKQKDDENIEKFSEELIKLAQEVYPEDANKTEFELDFLTTFTNFEMKNVSYPSPPSLPNAINLQNHTSLWLIILTVTLLLIIIVAAVLFLKRSRTCFTTSNNDDEGAEHLESIAIVVG